MRLYNNNIINNNKIVFVLFLLSAFSTNRSILRHISERDSELFFTNLRVMFNLSVYNHISIINSNVTSIAIMSDNN